MPTYDTASLDSILSSYQVSSGCNPISILLFARQTHRGALPTEFEEKGVPLRYSYPPQLPLVPQIAQRQKLCFDEMVSMITPRALVDPEGVALSLSVRFWAPSPPSLPPVSRALAEMHRNGNIFPQTQSLIATWKRERACNKYTSDGIPIAGECDFGSRCWYIHPNEPDWARLKWKNGRGYLTGVSKSRSRSRERDTGWDRKRLDREKGTRRERDREGGRERSRDGRDRDRDHDRGQERPRSPYHGTRTGRLSSRRLGSYRDRSPPHHPPRPRGHDETVSRRVLEVTHLRRQQPQLRANHERRQEVLDPRPATLFLLRSPEERKPDLRELERARLQQRAKQGGRREVIDLRDPVSAHPSNLRLHYPKHPNLRTSCRTSSLYVAYWDERVSLLADLVGLSSEVEDVKNDMDTIRRFTECSTMLPEESRERLRERLGQAEAKLHTKQAEYERRRDSNADASTRSHWPISREQMERDMTLLSAYKEMVDYLANLTKIANDLQKELSLLGVGKMPEVPVAEALKEDVEAKMKENEEKEKEIPPLAPPLPSRKRDEDAMQVDGAPPPPPPLPYRPPTISTPSSPPAVPPLPHRPSSERTIAQRDLDEISSRFDAIEKDLGAINNAVWQRENELRDEFEVELEGRLHEVYAFVKRGGKPLRTKEGSENGDAEEGDDDDEEEEEEEDVGHEEDPEVAAMQKTLDEMGLETKDGVKEVAVMTEILENFHTRLEVTETQQPEAVLEYQAALKRNTDVGHFTISPLLHNRLLALEAADRTSSTTIETLQNTLRVHIAARPPSPPSSPAPSLPSASLLLHFFREPMKAELRKAVVPIIEDVRAGVKRQLEEDAKGLYATVWERVEGSVRVLGSVERVLAQGVNGVNAVNGVNGVNGTGSH
ncbi:hypothetical protein FA13DRAFT_1703784 [Coprinellus micaceus]|uniref:C3H1-type domain-containing protein n=1 Tax=Coprinellus micaceus TaxID=71717 RepID=A0A4Y7U123_COPMI|nr:hypothetical protein FA13DRAFT_1703784 [Coprinellus micaceus]